MFTFSDWDEFLDRVKYNRAYLFILNTDDSPIIIALKVI